MVGAVIVSVALVAVVIVRAGPVKSLLADNLDVAATQAAVQGVLTDSTTGYGLHDVKDVTCNTVAATNLVDRLGDLAGHIHGSPFFAAIRRLFSQGGQRISDLRSC
ncbi:hypothetical protein BST46_26000 [Mycobacterium timonense]|uniref:DUF732 domain-containing protein n=1 Tax=Mycobacterium timonense TaxID=701043 RepID=A0ABX3TEI9_9MYCO|nr:hypothetical protein BST46_26000 [Mycobacterium timonense]